MPKSLADFLLFAAAKARFGNPLDIECHDQGEIVQTGKIAARHAANQSF
jgi:hypothetical protein